MPQRTTRRGQFRGQGQRILCDRCGGFLFEHPPDAGVLDGYYVECEGCGKIVVHPQQVERARQELATAARLFEETKNPTHAWIPLADAIHYGLDLPPSIRDYLLGVSLSIAKMTYQESPRNVSTAVAKALGFYTGKGAGSPLSEWRRTVHEFFLARLVWTVYAANRADHEEGKAGLHDLESIFKDAAVRHNQPNSGCPCGRQIGWQRARDAFKAHFRGAIPAHLVPGDLREGSEPLRRLSDILR